MRVSISVQLELDSNSVMRVISVLIAMVHFIYVCGLR